MSDSAKQDDPRPPASSTDPAFKATGGAKGGPPPRGTPIGAPARAGGAPGAKPDAKPDAFKVIRTAPPAAESEGPGLGAVLVLVALVIVAIGGVLYSRRAATSATPGTTPGTTTAPPAPAAKPAPDFVLDSIDELETVSGSQRALDKAREYRAEYRGAANLEARIALLERKLGQAPSASNGDVGAQLEQAQRLIQERRFDEALELTHTVVAESQNPLAVGAAYVLSGQAHGGKGDAAAAMADLQAAEDAGYDRATVDRVRASLRR